MANELCFVIQGFGEKTDFPTGRKLNLDASYEVIKEAVEEAGLRCVRADEIRHAGTIDIPMYRNLLRADLVIADLSTHNINAAYELGIRYGLRPHATIIVAEEGFKRPFDVSHISVLHYKHLGDDVGAREAKRLKTELKKLIAAVMATEEPNSPVYELLHGLQPPFEALAKAAPAAHAGTHNIMATAGDITGGGAGGPTPDVKPSLKYLLESARAAIKASQFERAIADFSEILKVRPGDDYARQQLALATYKSKKPDVQTALLKAKQVLSELQPEVSNDPETLGLWGAVHKRLWELNNTRPDLDTALDAHERGFYVKQDHYNGINLAFLLNIRAGIQSRDGKVAEAIADFVAARRVRSEVIKICGRVIAAGSVDGDDTYWIPATAWEAAVGLGNDGEAAKWEAEAKSKATAAWMLETTMAQIGKLAPLLADSPLRHIA